MSNWLFMMSWWSIVISNCSTWPCFKKVDEFKLFIDPMCCILGVALRLLPGIPPDKACSWAWIKSI